MKLKMLIAGSAILFATGCASIMDGSSQTIRIMPMKDGLIVSDSTCVVSNSKGSWLTSGGNAVVVKKANNDLLVNCVDNRDRDSIGNAAGQKKIQKGYIAANFLIGGLCTISCIIDFSTAAIFKYPTQLVVPMRGPEVADPYK